MNIPENKVSNDESVTIIISRRVKSGKEREFEEWSVGIAQELRKFEGYLGTNVLHPSDHMTSEYVVIIKFNKYSNLKNWEDSSIRAKWIERAGDFTEGDVEIQKLTGLEYWFTLPKTPLKTPPPRYKMAIVTFLALFPTINLVNLLLNPLLDSLHGTVRLAITVMITVGLMTYLVMPLMTRLLAFWLYGKLLNVL